MNNPATDRLVQAYNRMMERLHHTLEDTESKTLPALRHGIEKARDTAVDLGELTHEEADRVAAYVKRDAEDAGAWLADTGQELKDWLRFDLHQVEDRLLETFAGVADRTRLEILELQQELERDPPYNAGEITGPGTIYCTACNAAVTIKTTRRIDPCPNCGNETFRRWPLDEEVE
jgi:hypothetical protein